MFKSDVGPDGQFFPAVAVAELNTPFRETHPSIRQDGLVMVFSSNRPGGFGGIDLWVSRHPSTADVWGSHVSMSWAYAKTDPAGTVQMTPDGQPLLALPTLNRREPAPEVLGNLFPRIQAPAGGRRRSVAGRTRVAGHRRDGILRRLHRRHKREAVIHTPS